MIHQTFYDSSLESVMEWDTKGLKKKTKFMFQFFLMHESPTCGTFGKSPKKIKNTQSMEPCPNQSCTQGKELN